LKVIGSIGHPVQLTEFKVVDSETDEVLPPGSKGILKVRGPPVMKGYFKVIYFTCTSYDFIGVFWMTL
jgi:long-subunit acyl-CoA synthetase (AMP-forming)